MGAVNHTAAARLGAMVPHKGGQEAMGAARVRQPIPHQQCHPLKVTGTLCCSALVQPAPARKAGSAAGGIQGPHCTLVP